MEAPEGTALDLLRGLVCSLVSDCADEDLLDLISKLLMCSGGG